MERPGHLLISVRGRRGRQRRGGSGQLVTLRGLGKKGGEEGAVDACFGADFYSYGCREA